MKRWSTSEPVEVENVGTMMRVNLYARYSEHGTDHVATGVFGASEAAILTRTWEHGSSLDSWLITIAMGLQIPGARQCYRAD